MITRVRERGGLVHAIISPMHQGKISTTRAMVIYLHCWTSLVFADVRRLSDSLISLRESSPLPEQSATHIGPKAMRSRDRYASTARYSLVRHEKI